MKIGEELKREIGQSDPAFRQAIRQTLEGLETKEHPAARPRGVVLAVALVIAMMLGVTALAAGGRSVLTQRLPACTP